MASAQSTVPRSRNWVPAGWFESDAAPSRLGSFPYCLLLFGVVCQGITVWITWPLWQSRAEPPHLPTFDLPQVSFGWMMIASLTAALKWPRVGVTSHWIVLIVASVFDQFRLQPQFFATAILMTACVWPWARIAARWFLASTWLWSGLHKFLSPDWFGHASYGLIERSGLDAESVYLPFALMVALTEVAIGMLACLRPKWAAVACVPMHLGIVAFLSPMLLNWNESVIPWNLSMAVIGSWVMWHAESWKPTRRWETVVAAVWLIAPAGFFVGWIDHGFAGVLYSDSLPRGWITTSSGVHAIRGWGDLAVPFPNERRTLRMYFERWAEPGDKLHVSDPRPLLEDQYFVLDTSRQARPIDADTFFLPQGHLPDQPSSDVPAVAGVGLEERRAIFALGQAGVRMVRPSIGEPVDAVAFTPNNYDVELLAALEGLPNLLQVELSGTAVTDDDLRHLTRLRLLSGIGLNHTEITDTGLRQLRELPFLSYVECEGTEITPQDLDSVLKRPFGSLE